MTDEKHERSIEAKYADLGVHIQREVDGWSNRILGLETVTHRVLDSVEGLETWSKGVDIRLDAFDKRFDGIDKRLDAVDARFDGIDRRLDAVDARFDAVDKRFDGIDQNMEFLKAGLMAVAVAVKAEMPMPPEKNN